MKYRRRNGKKTQKKKDRFVRLSDWGLSAKFRSYYSKKAKVKACLKQMTR